MDTMFTPDDAARLRELLAKAAPPPWFVGEATEDGLTIIEDGRSEGMFPVTGETFEIELIVAAVNALPDLLCLIESVRAENKRLRSELQPYLKREEAIASARETMRREIAEEREARARGES